MNTIFKDLVAFFGTQEATAEKLKVDQSTVSEWVREKHGMPPVIAKRAEALTGGAFKKSPFVRRFHGQKWLLKPPSVRRFDEQILLGLNAECHGNRTEVLRMENFLRSCQSAVLETRPRAWQPKWGSLT